MATESSLGTFSTPADAPTKRLPFVSVSGGGRMPIGPGGPLWPLLSSVPITRHPPAAAGVPRCRRVQHHQRPGAQYRPHAPLAPRMHRSRRPPPTAARRPAARAPSTVRILRFLVVCTAVDAPRRTPLGGGLFLRRPATGRPAA